MLLWLHVRSLTDSFCQPSAVSLEEQLPVETRVRRDERGVEIERVRTIEECGDGETFVCQPEMIAVVRMGGKGEKGRGEN